MMTTLKKIQHLQKKQQWLQEELTHTQAQLNWYMNILKVEPTYDIIVVTVTSHGTIQITQQLNNYEEYSKYLLLFGLTHEPLPLQRKSQLYYRVQNTLLGEGKGYPVLDTPRHCDAITWKNLQAGIVPEHILA